MITNRDVSKDEYREIFSCYPYIELLDSVNITVNTILRCKFIENLYNINYNYRYSCMVAISVISKRNSYGIDYSLLDRNPYQYLKILLPLIPNKYKDSKGISGLLSQRRNDINMINVISFIEEFIQISKNNEYLCCDTMRSVTVDNEQNVWRYKCYRLKLVSTSHTYINDIIYLYTCVDTLDNFNKIFDTERSNSLYFDLEKFSNVNSRTWKKKQFKDDTLRIVSDDEHKFNLICGLFEICVENSVESVESDINTPTLPKKKIKRKAIPKKIRRRVWDIDFQGQLDGYCFCCDDKVDYDRWECGHILADANGGEIALDNLKVLCFSCNRSMGNEHMKTYMERNYPELFLIRGHLLPQE